MSSPAVIRAASNFTTKGQASRVSVTKEIAIGMTLGLAAGLWWKTYHWEEKRKIEQYYYDLAKLNKAQSAQQEG